MALISQDSEFLVLRYMKEAREDVYTKWNIRHLFICDLFLDQGASSFSLWQDVCLLVNPQPNDFKLLQICLACLWPLGPGKDSARGFWTKSRSGHLFKILEIITTSMITTISQNIWLLLNEINQKLWGANVDWTILQLRMTYNNYMLQSRGVYMYHSDAYYVISQDRTGPEAKSILVDSIGYCFLLV